MPPFGKQPCGDPVDLLGAKDILIRGDLRLVEGEVRPAKLQGDGTGDLSFLQTAEHQLVAHREQVLPERFHVRYIVKERGLRTDGMALAFPFEDAGIDAPRRVVEETAHRRPEH